MYSACQPDFEGGITMTRGSVWLAGMLIAIAALVAIPRSAARAADEDDQDIEQMVASAKTSADHEAIAKYFDREAKHDHKLAVKYKKIAASYKSLPRMAEMEQHCSSLADFYKNAAQEASLIAARHEAMAKGLNGQ
jgi:FKBP-type peptidyl-prolyl cis-trans isomerase (trigger factor)